MSEALFSPSWYRVAALKPRIRAHTLIHRHAYRGKVWFVLQDEAAGRSHRFSPAAHHFIGLMDGERTVQEIWEATSAQLGDEAPTQEEVIRLLGQLHAADALLCDVPPDSMEVFRRHQRHERMEWKRRLWTPLALRFPLWDPDRFLRRTLPVAEPLFGWFGVLLWLAVVGTGAVLAATHWTDLTKDVVDRILAPQNLLLLWLVYPVVKALHELGHAYATRHWGGEVHEIGIMLLVLTPVPYVDATSAWGFREKHKRMAVGAAGIAVELFLGALALFVWLSVESGGVRAVAYNVMLISGVSTLLFNGNPLLRFDGYYVLADALEIPNLGTRANKYLGYLVQRYLFRVEDPDCPAETIGERVWMVIYGIASFIYRVFIMFVIITFIATKFFFVGVLLAIWAIATQIVMPVGKVLYFLATSPVIRRQRGRAVAASAALVAVVLGLVFALPIPNWTRAQGVVWVPEEAQVRAGTEGFVARLLAPVDTKVVRGQPLIEAHDPFLRTRVAVLQAQMQELNAQYDAMVPQDRVQAAMVREEMQSVAANLERSRGRADPAQPGQRSSGGAGRGGPARAFRQAGPARRLRGRAQAAHGARRGAPGRYRAGAGAHARGRGDAFRLGRRPGAGEDPARGAGGIAPAAHRGPGQRRRRPVRRRPARQAGRYRPGQGVPARARASARGALALPRRAGVRALRPRLRASGDPALPRLQAAAAEEVRCLASPPPRCAPASPSAAIRSARTCATAGSIAPPPAWSASCASAPRAASRATRSSWRASTPRRRGWAT